jgi:endonuclease V-like protein UPF0215 family
VAVRLHNVVGFDDGPFPRHPRTGQVLLVGAVCARVRLDGVVAGRVARDGTDATGCMADLVASSHFAGHIRAIVLNGIAVAGFNVVDIHALQRTLERPVLVLARRAPRLDKIRRALDQMPDGAARWALIERAGPMEPLGPLFVQRAGLTLAEAADLVAATTLHGRLPEPLRLAHLIAGASPPARAAAAPDPAEPPA